ncbi:MAG: 5'-3' exonuclease H3TH domain-containing protein [Halioglobus sp.]
MSTQRAWLIDASIYIFRAWFSLPDRWQTKDGWPVHAVYGYTSFLLDFIDDAGPGEHCAAAFDESLGSCYRNDILASYKASRELPDDALAFQLRACKEVTQRLGMPCYGGSRYEADDYLASLARLFQERNIPVSVVTRDKDLGQIMQGPQDHWLDFAGRVTLNAEGFRDKFGVRPNQFADYLALVGDPTDDIPGVPGIGAKTAARLLQAFDNLATLEQDFERVAELDIRGAKGVSQRLQEHWPQLLVARQLTGLEAYIPEVTELPKFRLEAENIESVIEYLEELGIGGPLTRRLEKLGRRLSLL